MPAGNCPAAIVRVTNATLIASTHETLDVIGAKAKVATRHRIDELLHLESGIEIAFGPVEFDGAVCKEVNRASVRPILASRADHGVFFVFDGPEIEKCLVKLGQSRQAVSAQIHVMKLEFHG